MTIHIENANRLGGGTLGGRMARAPLPLATFKQPGGPDPVFEPIREWTRFYVLNSFAYRPARLGDIEQHPDFE